MNGHRVLHRDHSTATIDIDGAALLDCHRECPRTQILVKVGSPKHRTFGTWTRSVMRTRFPRP